MNTATSMKSRGGRSSTATIKETDLFEPVKRLFEEQGYTIYSEVEGPSGRADVVAVHGAELVVVELKTSLSLELMEQANGWRHYAHRIYVAVPKPKRTNHFARYVLRTIGAGLIEVTFPEPGLAKTYRSLTGDEAPAIAKPDWLLHPRWNRNLLPDLRNALREEQRNGPPGGSAGGGYVTDYKLTMERVKDHLRGRTHCGTWLTVPEILEHCETHYASPRSSLAQALIKFEADWCESKKEGGKLHFRYRQPAPVASKGG